MKLVLTNEFVCCFTSSSPSLPLSTKHTRLCSISPSLPVLLLLSEQTNEAEEQWSARAIRAHYARIHSLSHKQSGKRHWKTKQAALSRLCSLHISAKRSQMQATLMENKSEKQKKKPWLPGVRARIHIYVPFPPSWYAVTFSKLYKHHKTMHAKSKHKHVQSSKGWIKTNKL